MVLLDLGANSRNEREGGGEEKGSSFLHVYIEGKKKKKGVRVRL